jgi:hypothetical protein
MYEPVPDILDTWLAVSIMAHDNHVQDCVDAPPRDLTEALVYQGYWVDQALRRSWLCLYCSSLMFYEQWGGSHGG